MKHVIQDQSTVAVDLLRLIGNNTRLRKVATTCGGEYVGRCPRCGGCDRLRVQPYAQPKPRWTCRQCLGVERWSDAPGYLMWHNGLRYGEARAALGLPSSRRPTPAAPIAPDDSMPPPAVWQIAAARFLDATQRALWHHVIGDDARTYLRRRGFTDATIRKAGLGYNAVGRHSRFALWGLPDHPHRAGVWLPPGIVIPWYVDGAVWKLMIRQSTAKARYLTVTGSANVLYNVDALHSGCRAALVEGPFDALAIQHEAGDLIASVASGITGARRMRWIIRLAMCSEVLIAFDAEEATNRDVARAITYWREVLQPRARRLKPTMNDPAAMLEHGRSVRAWIETAIVRDKLSERGHNRGASLLQPHV